MFQGLRFGLVETKVVLTALLKNCKVTVNEKTKERAFGIFAKHFYSGGQRLIECRKNMNLS
jgi:hypothetical protein